MTVLEMTVSDAGGSTEPAGNIVTADGNPFVFYVKPSTGDGQQVRIVMPLGGNESGLFRQPRIGEKVLVGQEGTDANACHYLLGYIPNTDKEVNLFSPPDTGEKAEVFRYKQTGKKDGKAGDEKYSEIGFYHKPTQWTTSDNDETNYGDFDDGKPKIDRINIHSTGDINESAVNYHQVKANRLELLAGEAKPAASDSFKAGDLNITAGEDITIKAGGVITLKAGRTTLTISDDGFKVTGQLMSKLANPADASISLSALDGVSVSGKTVGIKADRAWSASDKFGAGISGTAGALTLGGREITAKTAERVGQIGSQVAYGLDYGLKLTLGGMALKDTPDKEAVNIAKTVFESGKALAEIGFLAYKMKQTYGKLTEYQTKFTGSGSATPNYPNMPNGAYDPNAPLIVADSKLMTPAYLFLAGTYLEPYEKVASGLDMLLEITEIVHSAIATWASFKDDPEALDKLHYSFLIIEEAIILGLTTFMITRGVPVEGNAALALGFDGSVVIKAAKNKEFYGVNSVSGAAAPTLYPKWALSEAMMASAVGELPSIYNLIATNIERYEKEPGKETL